jgi:NADH dehydrogenase
MLIRKICMVGGTGFVGRTLANHVVREHIELRILTRNRERHKDDLILLPDLELIQTDVHDVEQLKKHFSGCDAVINLVGILNERGRDGSGFRRAHVELTRKILEACRHVHIKRLLHMSALNADAQTSASHYLRTKGEAEDMAHQAAAAHGIRVTSFRPSVIFGREDSFFNRFAKLLKLTPLFFPLACARTRFAPVFVGDVAQAFVRTLKNPGSYGQRYELCGPKIYTLEQLVSYTAACIGIRRKIIPLNDLLSRMQAAVFDFVPGKPFSTDNFLSARLDSVCKRNGLNDLGIPPVAVEAVVPQYLAYQSQRARYNQFRSHTHRNHTA